MVMKHLLSIAGTDPSGGAGAQADLKTFCAHGCYAMNVTTAVVAQNTQGVIDYMDVPASSSLRRSMPYSATSLSMP